MEMILSLRPDELNETEVKGLERLWLHFGIDKGPTEYQVDQVTAINDEQVYLCLNNYIKP